MNEEDARRLGFGEGERVVLENAFGTFTGRVVIAPLSSRTIQVHYPESNVLVDPKARSSLAQIPAFKEVIATIRPARSEDIIKTPLINV
jgi:formylmethanofuran dehydrogenase subunit D